MDNQTEITFNSKVDYFRGGMFIVNLSPFEAANRIFIPGHRFLPFLNPAVRPWKVKIQSQEGQLLPQKIFSAQPENLKALYSLYGEENFLFLMIDDRPENSAIILDSTDNSYSLNLTVYDLSALLPEKNDEDNVLQAAIVFRIESWEKGLYTAVLRHVDRKNTEAGEWVERLEKGFRTILEKNKKLQMVPEVMSDAFIYGGKVLLENPVISLEDFFEISDINDIADMIAEQKEDPVIAEKKRYVREKTIELIKTFTSWLESSNTDNEINPEAVKILEKQILMTKRTLIAVLEELNNPFLKEDMIRTMFQVIEESRQLVSKIR